MRLSTLFLSVALLGGCKPTCLQVCDKLVDCENPGTERMNGVESEESCKRQETLYDDQWTDTQLADAFDAEMACLHDAECADIAAGACYDESVWSYTYCSSASRPV